MQTEKGVTRTPAPVGRQGTAQSGEVVTYDLKEMSPLLVDQLGLAKYLREHAEDEKTTE